MTMSVDMAGWPHDIHGSIINITRLGNGRALLLARLSGYRTGEVVFVRGIKVERHLALNQGAREVAIYNLIMEGDHHYREGPLTTCYPSDSFSAR